MTQDASNRENGRFEFSAARGGPFYELQARLKLLREDNLRSGWRAFLFVIVGWAIPFGLCVAAGEAASYLGDFSIWAKYVVAVGAFILAEARVDRGLRFCFLQFIRGQLIPQQAFPAAAKAVARALKLRNSALAEAVCFVIAYAISLLGVLHLQSLASPTWAVAIEAGRHKITPAGWWTLTVSQPLFVFLFLRMLWRHFAWSRLLQAISRIELRLVAAHPDHMAGLSFVARYPNFYMLFVFGASVALAAGLIKNFDTVKVSATTLTAVMVGWLILVLGHFLYPLSAFSKPLALLKETTILRASLEETRFWRQSERKTFGRNIAANSEEEARTGSDVADPAKHFDAAEKVRVALLTRKSLLPVSAAALVPLALVGVSHLPLKEILTVLKKVLLL